MSHHKIIKTGLKLFLILMMAATVIFVGLFLYVSPQLPSIEGLSDVRLQVPLRIYSSDGTLTGEFGEKRRTPKTFDEIPPLMRQAFLSAEDDRFYSHPGVDYQGILRAAVHLIKTGKRGQGGSTITMQLARNFYLSSEKTYIRKLNEIFLALKIENALPKEKIFELYLNKIYLGKRAYGVAAAANVYYGLELEELSLAQIAMIAGLPKAPSRYNPIYNPERALARRVYVLSRMKHLGFITEEQYSVASAEPITAKQHSTQIGVEADYVNEMVRAEIVKQFGDEAYTRGLYVTTTISDRMQKAANDSLWAGLVNYDKRHGYRGVVRHEELSSKPTEQWQDFLSDDKSDGRFQPALVINDAMDDYTFDESTDEFLEILEDSAVVAETENISETSEPEEPIKSITVLLKDGSKKIVEWSGLSWAKPYIDTNKQGNAPETAGDIVEPGDVVWVYEEGGVWNLGQIPEVQGALVAISPNDGSIKALNGGFDFHRSKFNRVTQAKRQAGSSFKPIVYSSALAKSFTPASLINDAPVVFEDSALEGEWRPENYSGKFYGPTRLRKALIKSRNMVSIRVLRSIGISHTINFAEKFGLDKSELPRDLSLSLGSCTLSPIELTRAFSVFANGGYLIQPHIIKRIEDLNGDVLFEADPVVACVSCVLSEREKEPLQISDKKPVLTSEKTTITGDSTIDPLEEMEANSIEELEREENFVALPKQAERTLDERIAYQINTMLKDVVKRGTGRRALSIGRKDLAGKTGTTNDQRDAWFNGYNADLVATAWIGFDQLKPLGNRETGSSAALPIWVDFMKEVLKGSPEKNLERPEGLVTIKINAETGEAATDLDKNTMFEIFREENAPVAEDLGNGAGSNRNKTSPIPEQLF